MTEERLYWVDVGFATAGVVTDAQGSIVDAAPIFRRWVGRHLNLLVVHYRVKGTCRWQLCEGRPNQQGAP